MYLQNWKVETLDMHVNWSIINVSFTNEAVPPSVDST